MVTRSGASACVAVAEYLTLLSTLVQYYTLQYSWNALGTFKLLYINIYIIMQKEPLIYETFIQE